MTGNDETIRTMVGGDWRAIPMVTYLDVHTEVAELYRAEGLRGDALDAAINDAMPEALAGLLGEPCSRH